MLNRIDSNEKKTKIEKLGWTQMLSSISISEELSSLRALKGIIGFGLIRNHNQKHGINVNTFFLASFWIVWRQKLSEKSFLHNNVLTDVHVKFISI